MKKAISTIAICLTLMVTGAPKAIAGCADTAGKVLGAFFSGGASYAICQIKETIQSLLRTIETVRNSFNNMINDTVASTKAAVHGSADDLSNNTNRAMQDIQTKVNDSKRVAAKYKELVRIRAENRSRRAERKRQERFAELAGDPLDGVQTTPNIRIDARSAPANTSRSASQNTNRPASTETIERSMQLAAKGLETMHRDLPNKAVNHIMSATRSAHQMAERHANAALRIARTSALAPLDQLKEMMLGLLRNPSRLFDPSSMVNETVERTTLAMTQVTEQIHHEVMDEAFAVIRDVDNHVRTLGSDLGKATAIHAAIQKLDQDRSQASLRTLNRLLADNGMFEAPPLFAIMPNLILIQNQEEKKANNLAKPIVDALKRENQKLERARLAGIQNRLPHNIEIKAKAELNNMMRGKSAAQQASIKQNLKQQLQREFRGNEKALTALNRDFDKRFTQLIGPSINSHAISPIGNQRLNTIPAASKKPALPNANLKPTTPSKLKTTIPVHKLKPATRPIQPQSKQPIPKQPLANKLPQQKKPITTAPINQ